MCGGDIQPFWEFPGSLDAWADTFGDIGAEVCEDCWYELPENDDNWYGMAPHSHDLTLTGSYIGSTVLSPLPEPDKNGVYAVDGLYFVPDDEVEGAQGMWYRNYPYEEKPA